MELRISALLAIILFVTGCDFFEDVSWSARLAAVPSRACVEKSLHAVPAIKNVDAVKSDAGSLWYNYRGNHVWGTVRAISKPDGTVLFATTSDWLNHFPSEFELNTQRDVFGLIFKRLKEHCPEMVQLSPVRETRNKDWDELTAR